MTEYTIIGMKVVTCFIVLSTGSGDAVWVEVRPGYHGIQRMLPVVGTRRRASYSRVNQNLVHTPDPPHRVVSHLQEYHTTHNTEPKCNM